MSGVGLYVPIVLVAMAVFVLLVVRTRPRKGARLDDGGGNTTDY